MSAGTGLDNLPSQREVQHWAGAACENETFLWMVPAAAVDAWRLADALSSTDTCCRS